MDTRLRQAFDDLLENVLDDLPQHLLDLLEELPLIVEDEPSDHWLAKLHIDRRRGDLCGVHWGIPLTQRSVEHSGVLPNQIMLFRGPIMRLSRHRGDGPYDQRLREQIRITLLHEIGHHFGMTEDDLTEMGYG